MDLLVLVNDPLRTTPDQSTARLVVALAARVDRLWIAGVDAMARLPDGTFAVWGHRVGRDTRFPLKDDPHARERIDPTSLSGILVRTNPGRADLVPAIHEAALDMLGMLQAQGVLVLNDPEGLRRHATKLSVTMVPRAHRPETLVTADRQALRAFVIDQPGRSVLKPVRGTRGQDVFFVTPGALENLSQILDVLVRQGPVVAQSFVPEAPQGDVRVLLVDGEPLQVDGHYATVRRAPGVGELRSNVAQGGKAAPAGDASGALAAARSVGPYLASQGLFLVGLDVIGDKVVEVNVFSPGGIADAGAFHGVDFIPPLVDALIARIRRGR